ncbi:MAG: Na+/H+ antiporter subunit E [Oscillospiraceae bacterium]|nr:Na+/H+ antiporter subunit E [Oscillospiraceae bacterium]
MFILFFLLWLLMAGKVTLAVCLWGAAVSALMCGFCRRVMGYRWRWNRRGFGQLRAVIRYLGNLLVEMLKAGFVVMKLIYTRGRDMEPKLIWFDTTLHSDRARATLADSITLTAGTITVETREGRVCVHALDASLAENIEKSRFQQELERLEA